MSMSCTLLLLCMLALTGTSRAFTPGQFNIPPHAHLAFPHLLSVAPAVNSSVLLVPLNHNSSDAHRISLRYWVDASCFKSGGPLFVHLGGEGEQGAVPCGARERQFGAISLSIEHRFYGKSWLADHTLAETLESEFLQHLNVKNALADNLAVIQHVLSEHSSARKVLSFGGSYSGGLSAFLRMRYPDTVLASVSESGVTSAVLDFAGFDTAIAQAAAVSADHPHGSDPCADRLRNATAAMERIAARGAVGQSLLLKIFNAGSLVDLNDFWYAVADGAAMLIQYGSKTMLCDALATTPWNAKILRDERIAEHLASIITSRYGTSFIGGCFYDHKCWSSPERAASGGAASMERQWRFQKCNEMAFLQDAPSEHPIRSRALTLNVLIAQCEAGFGRALGNQPLNSMIRAQFGSFKPKGSNIFFLDYSDDPWRAATVDRAWIKTSPAAQNLKSCYTTCNGCGHCGAGVPADFMQCHDKATAWIAGVLSM